MKDSFVKALKWSIVSVCCIGGFFFLFMAEAMQEFKPLMPMVWCFGLAYLLGFFWHRYKGALMYSSVLTFIFLAVASHFALDAYYIFIGDEIDLNYYLRWVILNFSLGFPIMFIVFQIFD